MNIQKPMTLCLILFLCGCISEKPMADGPEAREAVRLMDQGNYAEARSVFNRLAARGDTAAMVQVGLFYYNGNGVKKDYGKAMEWFLKAFGKQDADAFVNLGVMHRDGQGVPVNKKIAYCVFLATHMCGLGSESTQMRSNSCLRRIMNEMSKEDVRDCLSNYTLQYMTAYLEARGKMTGIPDKYKPSKKQPALKDLDWWLDGELDAIFGEPSAEEKKARDERAAQREKEFDAITHTLVFQIQYSGVLDEQYRFCDLITDHSIGSALLYTNKITRTSTGNVCEGETVIFSDRWRYLVLNNRDNKNALVYVISHPVRPCPRDWGKWHKPTYALKDNSNDQFLLCAGQPPKSKTSDVPANAPQIRFKVVKE